MSQSESPVCDWYRGRTIFITGASGLMGKVLIEKLLYACRDLRRIYILLRPKKGKTVQVRLEDMWQLPMFSRIRAECADQLSKVVALQGDAALEDLGLDVQSQQLITQEATVVFHFAATLKLEAKLKEAIATNTAGTQRVLDFCEGLHDLRAFVHLSTAFCYPDHGRLQEKVHPPTADPHDLMHAVNWMNERALDLATPALLQAHPNTYTYSKRLAEALVQEYYPRMRLAIARPSIVCPAWEEPVQGWVDNLNGPIGLLVGAGKGVIRTMHCNGQYHAEVIPVDIAINGLITIGYRIGTADEMPKEIPVYNMTTAEAKNTTWAEVLDLGKSSIREYPFESPLWYPDGDIHSNKLIHDICVVLFHLAPAYAIDLLMLIFGQKRFMVRIQNRITLGLELLQYFTTRDWHFDNDNFKDLYLKLTPRERTKFPMDFGVIDDREFIKRGILGGRQFCLKEPLTSLPKARVQNNVMFIVDKVVSVVFYGAIVWWIISCFDAAKSFAKTVPVIGPTLF